MDKVRFVLIGCGFIGDLHAGIINSLPDAELIAVADVNADSGNSFADKYYCQYCPDYKDVLHDKDIDAAVVCLPSSLHSAVTIEAAKAGKHVLCEKPIDIDPKRALTMVEACREHNVKLSVIMQHRFDDPVILLKKAIADGQMGRLLWGASRTIWYRDEQYFSNPWRGTWQYDGGGALINQSIHYIDLLLYIFGPVLSVSAKCRKLLHEQIETEDTGIANLEFASGAIGTVEGTTVSYPGLYAELCVFGEKGTVIIRNDRLTFYRFADGEKQEFEKLLDPQKANELHLDANISSSSHVRQYRDFVDAVLNDRSPLVTGEDALESLKTIKAIYNASNEKKEIYLRKDEK